MVTDWRSWMTQAENDLGDARRNLSARCYGVCIFLCQQAAEKSLKALYLREMKAEQPRTHSLKYLARKCGVFDNMDEETQERLFNLEKAYFSFRYPDVPPSPMKPVEADARIALSTAETVMKTVADRIKE